jgi:hypothetical protein
LRARSDPIQWQIQGGQQPLSHLVAALSVPGEIQIVCDEYKAEAVGVLQFLDIVPLGFGVSVAGVRNSA